MEIRVNKQHLFILCILFLYGIAQADTQIKIMGKDGGSTITSNGNIARIDNSSEPGYVLIDTTKQQFQVVDPQRRQVMMMDLAGDKNQPTSVSTPIKTSLKKVGKGEKIAGYNTDKYTLTANGKLCNTIYASKSAMDIKGISELFKAMNTMQQQSVKMMGGLRSMMDECSQAQFQSAQDLKTIGVPLKTIDANGQLESEIQSINSNAKVAKNYYQIPPDYPTLSMQQQMNQAQQQMQQNMPDMNLIMQQMMQNGSEMSPEAMEQIKKMQQMFQQ